MSVSEARLVLREAQLNFQQHLDLRDFKRSELADYLGVSTSYVSRLLNGQEIGDSAKDKLRKLFKYTNYAGDNWLI